MRERFAQFAELLARFTGSPYTVAAVLAAILVWLAIWLRMDRDEDLHLAMDLFIALFMWLLLHALQSSQSRGDKATHTKLDSILFHLEQDEANRSIGIEEEDEEAIDQLHGEIKNAG